MNPSKTIETFIKGYEKCRLTAFKPTPDDVWTIGWGRTRGVHQGMTQTQAQANADFAQDMVARGAAITLALGGTKTTQNQFDAMLSLAYNIGLEAFRNSTLLRLHKAGDYAGAKAQFARWNKQGPVVLKGLTERRAGEAAIYGA